MRVIIAGCRGIDDYSLIAEAVNSSNFDIDVVVSGMARGVDSLAVQYAINNGIEFDPYPADWDNLSVDNVVVRRNQCGLYYNALAGFNRNKLMAENAEALIAIWDGRSSGTQDMIHQAETHGLQIHIHRIDKQWWQ